MGQQIKETTRKKKGGLLLVVRAADLGATVTRDWSPPFYTASVITIRLLSVEL